MNIHHLYKCDTCGVEGVVSYNDVTKIPEHSPEIPKTLFNDCMGEGCVGGELWFDKELSERQYAVWLERDSCEYDC